MTPRIDLAVRDEIAADEEEAYAIVEGAIRKTIEVAQLSLPPEAELSVVLAGDDEVPGWSLHRHSDAVVAALRLAVGDFASHVVSLRAEHTQSAARPERLPQAHVDRRHLTVSR